jgi:hypothetical protein
LEFPGGFEGGPWFPLQFLDSTQWKTSHSTSWYILNKKIKEWNKAKARERHRGGEKDMMKEKE